VRGGVCFSPQSATLMVACCSSSALAPMLQTGAICLQIFEIL
jgi:hypothetical protein